MGGKVFYLRSFMIVCVRFYIMMKFFILHDLISIVLVPSYYLKALGARLLRLICLTTCIYERPRVMLTKKYSFSERRLTKTGGKGLLQLLLDMSICNELQTSTSTCHPPFLCYDRDPDYTRVCGVFQQRKFK
jgi:hypothetical protein